MRRHAGIVAIIAFALIVAWLIRFVCDDAFISFVYAKALVSGDGLTWFGDRVEGYTNFLWVLWSAAGLALGIDPVPWTWGASLGALAVTLIVTYRIAKNRAGAIAGYAAAGLLATNFTFLAFGTSGLETMLQTALLVVAWFEVESLTEMLPSPRRLAALSVIAALALWTRLDSAIMLVVLGGVALVRLRRAGARAAHYLAASGPVTLLVGGWLAWKFAYYGDVLPNTFHAKVGLSAASITAAARFAGAFLHAYLLWPVVLVVGVAAIGRRTFAPKLPAALCLAWLAYVVLVGGDFMEFRFFVPLMPPAFVVFATMLASKRKLYAGLLVALLASVSLRHAATFERVKDHSYDSVRDLGTFYGMINDTNDWGNVGRALGNVLAGSGATLATPGAGAIPYYSELPTVDQLGLNDRWIARHGARPPATYTRPGHQRFATLDYLVARKVTFVISRPTIISRGGLSEPQLPTIVQGWARSLLGVTLVDVPRLVVVAAPVDNQRALLMWYLTPTDEITRRIHAAGWEVREIVRAN